MASKAFRRDIAREVQSIRPVDHLDTPAPGIAIAGIDPAGIAATYQADGDAMIQATTAPARVAATAASANTAPTLTGLAASVTFAENAVNAAPALLDADVTFADAQGNFIKSVLTVSGLLAEDRVAIRSQGFGAGQIGLFGVNITYDGIAIGTFAGGVGATLTISLNSSATSAAVDALIQNLTYANVSDTPTASRTLRIDLRDDAGAALNATPATFVERTGATNPFNGIDVGGISAPGFVDLDGDGDLDAVVGALNGTLRSFRNTGGTFTELIGTANPFNGVDVGSFSAPAFVDLDGDGDRDAVVGELDGTLRSFRNTGGTFTELIGTANPFDGVDVGGYSAPDFADLDGDGDIDTVIGNEDGQLRSFRNTGGTFTALTGTANPFDGVAVGAYSTPAFVDLDGDGDLDAVIGDNDGTLRSFRNTGGTFTELTGTANPFDGLDVGTAAAPGFADVDGDGDDDAVIGNSTGTLQTFINTATRGATITVTVTAESDVPALTGLAPSVTFAENAVNAAPVLLDGDVVLAAGSASLGGGLLTVSGVLAEDRVEVRNEGAGAGQIGVSGSSITYGGVAIGTVSGGVGGTLTVALMGAASQAAVDALIQNLTYANFSDTPTASRTLRIDLLDAAGATLNATPAAFVERTGAANPFNGIQLDRLATPSLVDLDGDGDLDAVVGAYDGTLRSYQNTNGVFAGLSGSANPFAGVSVREFSDPSFVDLDGDGDLDAAIGGLYGIRSFRNTGGVFTELTGTANPFGGTDFAYSTAPSFVDLDGDGDLDMVTGRYDGTVRSFRNSGGTFTALTDAANPFNGLDVGRSSKPGFVDLDGDGDLDAVIGREYGVPLAFRNTGGVFTELTGAANPFDGTRVLNFAPDFADVDGDGDLDAVVGNYSGTLQTFINTATKGATITVTVTPQPDSTGPSATNLVQALSYTEDAGAVALDAIVVTGADAGDTITATLTLSDPAAGTITGLVAGTDGRYTATGSAAVVNAALAAATFVPTADGSADATIAVSITDGTTPAITGTITLDGTAVNDAPRAATLTGATVTENAARGIVVGTIAGVDVDAGDTLAYSLVDTAGGRFAIDATTGRLSVLNGALLDYETARAHDIQVEVRDAAGATYRQTFAIAVADMVETQTIVLTAAADVFTAPSANNWLVSGLAGDDRITTLGGNDAVRGGAGNDIIATGAGNDIVTFFQAKEGFDTIDGGEGIDRIDALANNTVIGLRALTNVEAISANGYTGVSIGGSALDDTLDFAGVTLAGIAQIDAGAGNDVVTGSGLGDRIVGGAGNDTLNGGGGDDVFLVGAGAGSDTFDGGSGRDVIVATRANVAIGIAGITGIEEISGGGFATTTITTTAAADTLDLSAVTLTGIAKIVLGNGNDVFTGSAGNDYIVGGAGDDTLNGGAGNDVFEIGTSQGNDRVDGGEGADTVKILTSSFTWANIGRVEAVVGSGLKLNGTAGDDLLDFGAIALTGVAKIYAGSGNDVVIGSAAADVIGLSEGRDTLTGGGGADVFDMDAVIESAPGAADLITDFVRGSDIISLVDLDASSRKSGNQAFTFIAQNAFSGLAGELRFVHTTDQTTTIYGDTNGDRIADIQIDMANYLTLSASDFIL